MKTKRSFKITAARRTLRSQSGVSLVVVIMLMVIILTMTGAGMFFSSIELRASGNHRAGTQAFYAADTGINAGYAQIALDQTTSTAAFSGTLSGGLKYCSGSGATTGTNFLSPQPVQPRSTRTD